MDIQFNLPEINLDNFDLSEMETDEKEVQHRYIKPRAKKRIKERTIKYDNAAKLSKDLIVMPEERVNVLLSGNFVFGDFVEAFIVDRDLAIKDLYIVMFSYGQENVDSLQNLMDGGFIRDNLNIITSDLFYSHEKNQLIPYTYTCLDKDNKFQLAACRHHLKLVMFETVEGKKCLMYGSANMRSSDNIELMTIEQNIELFDFMKIWTDDVLKNYATINKSIRVKELWNIITKNDYGK